MWPRTCNELGGSNESSFGFLLWSVAGYNRPATDRVKDWPASSRCNTANIRSRIGGPEAETMLSRFDWEGNVFLQGKPRSARSYVIETAKIKVATQGL